MKSAECIRDFLLNQVEIYPIQKMEAVGGNWRKSPPFANECRKTFTLSDVGFPLPGSLLSLVAKASIIIFT